MLLILHLYCLYQLILIHISAHSLPKRYIVRYHQSAYLHWGCYTALHIVRLIVLYTMSIRLVLRCLSCRSRRLKVDLYPCWLWKWCIDMSCFVVIQQVQSSTPKRLSWNPKPKIQARIRIPSQGYNIVAKNFQKRRNTEVGIGIGMKIKPKPVAAANNMKSTQLCSSP